MYISLILLHFEYELLSAWGPSLNKNGVKQLIKIKGKIEEGMSVIIPMIETVKEICEVSEGD